LRKADDAIVKGLGSGESQESKRYVEKAVFGTKISQYATYPLGFLQKFLIEAE
jgi:hypothetical protein